MELSKDIMTSFKQVFTCCMSHFHRQSVKISNFQTSDNSQSDLEFRKDIDVVVSVSSH